MTRHDYDNLPEEPAERYIARVARFAMRAGRALPRFPPGTDLAEVRRNIARLRRHELPPGHPDITHEMAAECLEFAVEQEEVIRNSAAEMNAGRRAYHDMLRRAELDRDIDAFHALKRHAAEQGGEQELLREMNRARRAAGGRSRRRR